uniref:Uncharacterized protein n=1 Tax=Nelumbo nucifera TaxID=4432 RepID=A0A822XCQ5_NELNU|nr:TPA_asm: hypothetical protein HUJ06_020667 [Nelumbo nucifera]
MLSEDEDYSDSDTGKILSLGSIDLQESGDILEEGSLNTDLLFTEEKMQGLSSSGLGIEEKGKMLSFNDYVQVTPPDDVLHNGMVVLATLAETQQETILSTTEETSIVRDQELGRT